MRVLVSMVLALLASAAAAQVIDMSARQAGSDAFNKGHALEAVDLWRAAALNADGSLRDEGAFQAWEQILPMLTGELPVGGLRPRTNAAPSPDIKSLAELRNAEPRDAIAEIVARARNTRVVILNEAHDTPRDRAFGLAVARALRPLGYDVLAAEAFSNPGGRGGIPTTAEQLTHDGFVRQITGYYTRDPVFAGFIREAMRIGYRPVSYEQTQAQRTSDTTGAGSIAAREAAEAQNLDAALFHDRADTKVLIYVGYGHVAEAPTGSGHDELWMAARLKRLTGIDPLTIDQTSVIDTKIDHEVYDAAAARIDRPSVFLTAGKPLILGNYAPDAVDLQVIHPRRSYRDGRPAWLATLGGHPLAIPPALLPTHGKRLIQAFAADAPADAVPLDQVLVEAGRPVPKLMVPPGKLRFAVQDPS